MGTSAIKCYYCKKPITEDGRSLTEYSHPPKNPRIRDGDSVCSGLPEGQYGYAIPEGIDPETVTIRILDEELTVAEQCRRLAARRLVTQ